MANAATTSKRSGKTRILIALLAMSGVMSTNNAIMPILNEISVSFPDASTNAIQMAYSVSLLVSLPIMLLSGVLVKRFSKKRLVLAGLLLLGIGGSVPVVVHASLVHIYIGSAFVGAGSGIVNILSSALISDYYDGVDKARVMGYQSAALSALGGICTMASGMVATQWHWWYSFALFLLALPVFVLVMALLPLDKPLRDQAPAASNVYKAGLIWWAVLAFLWSIFMYAFNTNISMFIDEEGFGGADVAGGVSSMFMIIGIPGGLILGSCIKVFKRSVVAVACAVCAVGMVVIGLAPNIAFVYVGAFLFGLGYAVRNPANVTFAAYLVPTAGSAAAIALVQALGTVAGFISPAVVNFLSSLFGGSFRTTFLVCGVAMAVLTVLYFVANPVKNEAIEGSSGEDSARQADDAKLE